MATIPVVGPAIADTVYRDGNLVAKHCQVTLPSVEFMLAEIQAGGTIEIPVPQIINAMDTAITKIGEDEKLALMVQADPCDLEYRWVRVVTDPTTGTTRNVGYKAFLHCLPKGIPEITLNSGEVSENEVTYSVTSYKLVIGGKEAWAIDKLNDVLRINGIDYYQDIKWML